MRVNTRNLFTPTLAAMPSALWLSLIVLLTSAVPLQHSNAPDKIPPQRSRTLHTQQGGAQHSETTDSSSSALPAATDTVPVSRPFSIEFVATSRSRPFGSANDLDSFMTCEHVPGFYSPRWLWVVTKCPTSWPPDDPVVQDCLSFDRVHKASLFEFLVSLPVQDDEGNVYANSFCAQCHGVEALKRWTPLMECSDGHFHATLPTSRRAVLNFTHQLNAYFFHPTCPLQIAPAMVSALKDCEEYHQRFRMYSNRLKNTRQTSQRDGNYGVPFTILFNFDFSGRTNLMFEVSRQRVQKATLRPRCRDWETFDPYTNMCRPVTCSKNYVLVNNKCQWDSKQRQASGDHIKSLNQLNRAHQTTTVTIFVNSNITQRSMDNLDREGMRKSLAELFNVDVERIENLKLTFEPGSKPDDVTFDYEVLTQERYLELFPPLTEEVIENYVSEQVLDPDEARHAADHTDDDDGDVLSTQPDDDISGNEGDKISDKVPDDISTESPQLAAPDSDNESSLVGNSPVSSGDIPAENQEDAQSETHHAESTISSTEISAKQSQQPDVPAIDPKDVMHQMIMTIDFVLVPPHNKTDGHPQRLMKAIRDLDNRFIVQIEDGEVTLQDPSRPDLADTSTFCPWGIEHRLDKGEFTMMTNSEGEYVLYANKTNTYLEVGRFDLFIRIAGDNAADISDAREEAEFAYVCFMPRINQASCSRIDLTADEYTIQGSQKDLTFEGKTYDIFSYFVKNETTGLVQICVPKSFGTGEDAWVSDSSWYTVVESCGKSLEQVQRAEIMITAILGRVSLVALSVVLLTYMLFPRLRNLPGINTMNLTFALLVAEAMFSEGIDAQVPWLCTAVAISLHYLFLAAHFWMSVMSYDVYRTFVNEISPALPLKRLRDRRKYVPLYSLYAWGTPLLIVAFCVLVDKSDLFAGVKIGYGGRINSVPHVLSPTMQNSSNESSLGNESSFLDSSQPLITAFPEVQTTAKLDSDTRNEERGLAEDAETSVSQTPTMHGPSQLSYCWISEPLAAFISFGAPILIIFTSNCIFFGRVITTISRTTKLSKSSLRVTRSTASLNRKMTGRSDAVLYLRMSTVMGFTWIFGLSSSIVSSFSRPVTFQACVISHVLGILFTIFNISQGIFIFGAFVCNRRVLSLYRALFVRVRSSVIKHGSKTSIYVINSTSTLSTSPDLQGP